MPEPEIDAAAVETVIGETVACLTGDTAPEWYGPTLFGGFVVGQATYRAAAAAPAGTRLTSLHGHFLRPMRTGVPVAYDITPVKAGRTVTVHQVESSQEGKPVFRATCSSMADVDGGYEYEMALGAGAPPMPEELEQWGDVGPFAGAWIGPTPQRDDGTYAATHRTWLRTIRPIDEDPALHTAFIAYFSDMTGPASRPLLLEPDLTGIVSLDHAIWFHRPVRADDWIYYELDCVLNTGGRSLTRGVMRDRSMRIVATMTQELIVTPS